MGVQFAGLDEPPEDVVGVGGDEETLGWQPHAAGVVPGQHVAEVAGGDAERDGALVGQAPHRPDVVDDLGRDPGPIDRVHRGQCHVEAERLVGEHRLHQVLAVIEGAVHGHRMDVGRVQRGHLASLDLAGAARGVKHHDVEAVAARHRLHRGGAGVARGGRDDHGPAVALLQLVVEQPRHHLQGDVLESEGWAVEQLEQPVVVVQRHQRAHVGMAEAGIGVSDQCLELVSVDGAAHIRGHETGGQVGVTESARLKGCAGSQFGHLLGDI